MRNHRFASGRNTLIGRSITYPVPIALEPGPYEGSVVHGENGLLYTSDGTQWRALADEARAAEIAEDVAANVIRVRDPGIIITVSDDPVVEGENYQSLGGALQYLSQFVPIYTENWRNRPNSDFEATILIKSGKVLSEQIKLFNNVFQSVTIFSEDPEVMVDPAGLTKYSQQNDSHYFIESTSGSVPPVFRGVVFRLAAGTIPQDPDRVAQVGAYTPEPHGFDGDNAIFVFADADLTGTPLAENRPAGIKDFQRNFFGGTTNIFGGDFSGPPGTAFITRSGTTRFLWSRVRGGIRCTGGTAIIAPGADNITPLTGNDFRRVEGVDSHQDISVAGGNIAVRAQNALGGTNVAPNTVTQSGILIDIRLTDIDTIGSGPNGFFARFNNGMQICWHRINLGSVTAAGAGTLADSWRTSSANWTYPAEFLTGTLPEVQLSGEFVGTQTDVRRACAMSRGPRNRVSQFSIQAWRWSSVSDPDEVIAVLTAFGRWR